jgi:hypothetical protein
MIKKIMDIISAFALAGIINTLGEAPESELERR